MMSKRVLILTGDAGESYETLYALHRLQEEGHSPVIAALAPRRLHLVIHDFEPGWDTYIERSPGYGVSATLAVAEASPNDFDAILLIGGRAPEYLRNHARVLDLVRAFDQMNKWIFSLCHGIQILTAAGLTRGRNLTCYEHVRFEVEQTDGTWCSPQAVRDGRYITGQTWESHPDFYRLVIAALREASAG